MAHRAAGNPTKAYRIAAEGIELGRSYEIPYELARTLAWAGETRLQSKQKDDHMIGRLQLWEARAVFERIGLANEVRQLDRVLGFEEEEQGSAPEKGIEALAGMSNLDRGALRFGIITCSPEMSEAVATIQSIAPSRIPVLITGPSGVGKELLAQALHQMSDRRRLPFVPVNCGAISSTLIESELFGHERGAFTGATTSREGLFATAERGTIFLDEIGELPPSTQATLLRVLETGELRKVGSDEVRTIDVRVVAATNADLEVMVERGRFRRDLYFRLEGVIVRVPPLREREDDIRALFRFFFAEAVNTSKKRLKVTEGVEPLLCAYAWPGNVRELRNEVARAVAMAEDGAVLGRDAFLPKLRSKSPSALRSARQRDDASAEERTMIVEALKAHKGNKADAARSLGGMKRTTLLYKIDRLSIRPEEYLAEER
jgi:transcriptional regulator with PAS, ATPase and Fis domain